MPEFTTPDAIIRRSELNGQKPQPFDLRPNETDCALMAAALSVNVLKKLRLTGTLSATGALEWVLQGALGATIQQECVVTLAPVVTRIDTKVFRRFARQDQLLPVEESEESELVSSSDDSFEPLPESFDLMEILQEALALEVPEYPRVAGAELGSVKAAPAGTTAFPEDPPKPFAGLAALRAKMEKEQ
ncbi:DUF177 domain-containing protein [Paracoccaceae bacterium]|nr:DUF177 domain-containing protein [Paracoccaceae bacterium]MED7678952.1 DUF177 domain-containing protein [Rhodobacteraceae bacterium IMCC15231]